MPLDESIIKKVEQLEEKYNAMGQDLASYLDGLIYADYLTYWDYVHLDTLLSLQNPRTPIKDEVIFIMYHQITELYFKLCLHELEQIAEKTDLTSSFLLARLTRINRYFEVLTRSFGIMVDGMEKEQFLKFRMSLLPASGFQSAQYRKIEIRSTDFINLVEREKRSAFSPPFTEESYEKMFEHIYWKRGATELASGKKTLTLRQFEEKYSRELIAMAAECRTNNLWQRYLQLKDDEQKEEVAEALRTLDLNVNVNWPLVHYKSAARYLQQNPEDLAATGGTNWQKYLPPRFQKRIFYPALWSDKEMEEWGKTWVKSLENEE